MFHLKPGVSLVEGVRGVARDQLGQGVALLGDQGVSVHERVHEGRKRCKKVRGLLRLVRDGMPGVYADGNRRLRDAARLVSGTRDLHAAVGTHDVLVAEVPDDVATAVQPVREALVARRDDAVGDELDEVICDVRGRLAGLLEEVDDWTLDGDPLEVLAAGYGRTYGRCRDRMEEALDEPSTEAWHDWRKRVKYHRYHCDLLREAWEPVLVQREELLHDLTDLLGDDHDLAVLRPVLADLELDGDVRSAAVAMLDRRRAGLQRDAVPLARRLLHAEVAPHVDAVVGWWARAVEEARADDGPADPLVPVGD